MPSTTQTRNVQINKKEETVEKDVEPKKVFLPCWELHSRLLTNFNNGQDNIWPTTSDSFYKTITHSNDTWVNIKNESDAFHVIVESAEFNPEELKVSTLNENLLRIEGRQVKESRIQNGDKYVCRQFSRSYILPANCKIHQMHSSFDNGKLVVTVPKTQPITHDKSESAKDKARSVLIRYIPIQSQQSFHQDDPFMNQDVRIHHDKTANTTHTDSTTPLDCTNIFQNKFDHSKLGQMGFSDWIRPIQIFDEGFFMESFKRSGSFPKEFVAGGRQMTPLASKVDAKESGDEFQFILPTDDYNPEELKVSVLDDVLKIDGQHAEEVSDMTGKRVSKHFSRSYVLPKHIYKMDQIESSIDTKQKKLVVKVPKIRTNNQLANQRCVKIPIKML